MRKQINPLARALGRHGKEIDQLFKAERTPENFGEFGKLMEKVVEEATGKKLRKCVECGNVSDKGLDIEGKSGKSFVCQKCVNIEEKVENQN